MELPTMVLVPARPPDDQPPRSVMERDESGAFRRELFVMDFVDGAVSVGIGVVVTIAAWVITMLLAGSVGTTGVLGIMLGGMAVGVMAVPVAFLVLIALTVQGVGPGLTAARVGGRQPSGDPGLGGHESPSPSLPRLPWWHRARGVCSHGQAQPVGGLHPRCACRRIGSFSFLSRS